MWLSTSKSPFHPNYRKGTKDAIAINRTIWINHKGRSNMENLQISRDYAWHSRSHQRKKPLALSGMQELFRIWEYRRTQTRAKIRISDAYVNPFLYNSEMWALTAAQESRINTF